MPSPIVVAVIVVVIVISYVQSLYHQRRLRQKELQWGCKPLNKYRHILPWGIDDQRAWLKAIRTGKFNRRSIELFNRYGFTYESKLFNTRIINTRDTENLKTMLATNHDHYSKQTFWAKAAAPLMGPGLITAEGADWKRSHDLVIPLFKRAEVSDISRLQRHVDKFLGLIPRDGSTVDLAPLLAKLSIDNSSEFIFGESINSLDGQKGEGEKFLMLFDEAHSTAGQRIRRGTNWFLLNKQSESRWLEKCREVHAIVDSWVLRAINDKKGGHVKDSNNSAQPHYILLNEMAKEISDPVRLRYELINVFGPSRGTVPALLTNIFFYLARHPEVWQKLRQQALDLGDSPITWEVLKSLTFFRYTAQEAIRLQGPSGQVQRLAIRDTVLPRGGGPDGRSPILVPKGTVIVGNNFPIYHDPKIWGEDVEEFKPSRFEGKAFQWEFVPFLGGPRICPAQPFVWNTAVYLLFRMVVEFETIENRDPSWDYVEAVKMTPFSKNGAQVALHPAGTKT